MNNTNNTKPFKWQGEYISINGYYKDDKTEFSDYVIRTYDDIPEDTRFTDNDIFYYGLSESDIKLSISGVGNISEFVVTSYELIN